MYLNHKKMAVMIPHRYKDEDFQIVLSPSPDGNQKYVRCRVSFDPINDKRFESDMLLSKEFINEDFYDHVCYQTVRLYNKSIVKGINLGNETKKG